MTYFQKIKSIKSATTGGDTPNSPSGVSQPTTAQKKQRKTRDKKDYDHAMFRVVDIMLKLYNDERPTMDDLVQEYNVTLRTIQNDIYKRLKPFNIEKNCFKQLEIKKEGRGICSSL
jgi:transcriptional antiterminator